MDRREDVRVTSLEHAKSWIENAFQRAGSSFRHRTSQLQAQFSRNQTSISSGTEIVDDTCDDFYSEETDMGDSSKLARHYSERKTSVHYAQRKISITKVKGERTADEKILFSSVEVKVDHTLSSSAPLQRRKSVISDNYHDNMFRKESFDTEKKCSLGSRSSTCLMTWKTHSILNADSVNSDMLTDKKIVEKPEESFSSNYQKFCEKLSSQEKETDVDLKDFKRVRSFAFIPRKSLAHNENDTDRSHEKKSSKINSRVKLSLLYFENSRQLRIILLTAEPSLEDNKKVFCKVTLTGNGTAQKGKTKKVRIESGRAIFNKCFYMKTEGDDIYGYTLRVKLCQVSQILQRHSVFGEAMINLEDIYLCLDTTVLVTLRPHNSSEKIHTDEDLEIVSKDRSIQAEARSMVQQYDDLQGWPLGLSRCRSLPHMSRYGVRK